MRQALTILAALVLGTVTAVGISAVEPREAGAASVQVRGCTGTDVSMTTEEKEMLDLHNRTRADRNLPRLCVHPALQRAARAHSKDMIERDYFSHSTKGKRETSDERVERYGYKRYRAFGENIAWGSGNLGSPNNIMDGWMRSDPHRKNILNGRFREVGIGAYTGTYKTYQNTTMWTADFGNR